MPAHLVFYSDLALSTLLAATLVYCIVLERRLNAVRKGQDALKGVIGELDASISAAGTSLRMLKSAASGAAATLDERLGLSRKTIDELSVIVTSGERIAERIERATARTAPMPVANPKTNGNAGSHGRLPSGSVMSRLESLRTAR